MPEESTIVTIKEVPTKPNEKVRINKRTYKGKNYFELRAYWTSNSQDWYPSKKGIIINRDHLSEVVAGLCDIQEEAEVTTSV